ncbi:MULTISPECIES: YitT family protein [unclassified Clostridium]|uniref:YitT family protein n=1 Tax=unclassified Clostridium TaxID=2614128 RepID=UPI00321754DC
MSSIYVTKQFISDSNIKEKLGQVSLILLGSLIYSLSVNMFIVPHKFLSGGVAGIALLLQYVTDIPSGYFTLFINIPIFCFGIKVINKEFGFLSFIGMISMSIFLILTEDITRFIKVDDLLISCISGGVLCGFGMAIIFLNKASEGGTDIIAIALKKKYGVNLASMTFILNGVIVFTGLILNDLTITIYTLISLFIRAYILDNAITMTNERKLIIVISNNPEEIKNSILELLGRGVTFLHGEGAFTGEKKKVIYSIMSSKQVEKAKKAILDIDANAVISIMNVNEAHGKGFKQLSF